MMDPILVDQIAAGEVVERPANVVKELLENALDAGANSVEVEIDEGGAKRVLVRDDGHGMGPEDVALSVQRHATSKLRRLEDLFGLRTLGFRGEALASIASVSDFSLVSRRPEQEEAYVVRVRGGEVSEVEVIGAAVGTTVEVRDLFFNVPARRKFLRAQQTESAQISSAFLRAALAHPGVRFVLTRNGRRSQEYLPVATWAERVRAAFPRYELQEVQGDRKGVTVHALLSRPEQARSGAGGLHIYINDRPVRDRSLARAVSFAFGDSLSPGRYPVGVVKIAVDASIVDVNVHPQKSEVRFQRESGVLDSLTRLLAAGLGNPTWGERGKAAAAQGYWERREAEVALRISEGTAASTADPWGLSSADGKPTRQHDATADAPPGVFLHSTADGLEVWDLQAALAHTWLSASRAGGIPSEVLLLPVRVDLPDATAEWIEAEESRIRQFGFAVASLGGNTFAIQRCPEGLAGTPVGEVFLRFVDLDSKDEMRARLLSEFAFAHGAVNEERVAKLRGCVAEEPSFERFRKRLSWESCLPHRDRT